MNDERTSWKPKIEPGDRRDYDRLARYHYLAGPPATIARWASGAPVMLRAVDATEPGAPLVGVLVVSMPTLNARWRPMAWGKRYQTPDRRLNARRLNDELRTISRVIVEPRYRSMGVASALVRAYLSRAATPATEAFAAMGGASPFFERAGMCAYVVPPAPRDLRLLDAFDAAGVEPMRLLDPGVRARWTARPKSERTRLVQRELRTWARASKGTRPIAAGPLGPIASVAAGVLAPIASGEDALAPRAYAHRTAEQGARP